MNRQVHLLKQGAIVSLDAPGFGLGAVYADWRPVEYDALSQGDIADAVVVSGNCPFFDIVFASGLVMPMVSAHVLSCGPWLISGDMLSQEELRGWMDEAATLRRAKDAEGFTVTQERADAVARLKADPAYAHLSPVKERTDYAAASANIRKELRKRFAGTKFSVQLTMHAVAQISWRGGPSLAEVKSATVAFQSARKVGEGVDTRNTDTAFNEAFGGLEYLSYTRAEV
ncbi:ribosomal protein L13E [Pseudomonas nitritireducens]|uniref:Ribosomal protein L13E n=1 Tax=Pseudomonas nitroreducens TaxID=46680 RepID=A0A7W7KFR4_PSENT|nr:LPD29 domain-containing protein [Pseudomonas nitritireducens]MBB4861504.1 ribosomal protein L13E [Pseudomonas nitritireducens]